MVVNLPARQALAIGRKSIGLAKHWPAGQRILQGYAIAIGRDALADSFNRWVKHGERILAGAVAFGRTIARRARAIPKRPLTVSQCRAIAIGGFAASAGRRFPFDECAVKRRWRGGLAIRRREG